MQLTDIKYLGEKRIQKLREAGIKRPEDLLLCYPYKYLDLSQEPDFSILQDGDEVLFLGKVDIEPVARFVRRGLYVVKTAFAYRGLKISAAFFNQRHIVKQLTVGKLFYVSGKVKKFRGLYEIKAPVLTAYREKIGGTGVMTEIGKPSTVCLPIYKSIKGLPVSVLSEAIQQVLNAITVESYVPVSIAEKYGLMCLDRAIRKVHLPESYSQALHAAESLAIENLANNLCIYNIVKKLDLKKRGKFYDRTKWKKVQELIETLPYNLTDGQKSALTRILDGLHSENGRLNALLEGDVGSGKTMVAFLAMYYAAVSGYQSVLMAPTELLAAQHYKNALKLFEGTGVQTAYLSSGQSAMQRDTTLFHIKCGNAQIVIGTHAVIQKDIEFQNLSLVITDEQHRFGVLQRGNLENKSDHADVVVMSATPIPRTLALTLYGDLEPILIPDRPPKKAKTATRFVSAVKENDMYRYLAQKCAEGEQCFIVCPRIEEDGNEDWPSVSEVYAKLLPLFKPHGIAVLHGKLHDAEKTKIMAAFTKKEIKALVTTTVIEVGIDYQDATGIVILNAERYGLGQLHQLRGRVGRGEKESYCFILSDNDTAKQRLEMFCASDNGFELAEYDFKTRGAGDFLGTRQHGMSGGIRITPEIIQKAKLLADELAQLSETKPRIPDIAEMQGLDFIKNLTLN